MEEFEERELYQPDTEIIRKPRPKRLRSKSLLLRELESPKKRRMHNPGCNCQNCCVCQEPDCGASTSGNKPYCIKHLGKMPYVATIQV